MGREEEKEGEENENGGLRREGKERKYGQR